MTNTQIRLKLAGETPALNILIRYKRHLNNNPKDSILMSRLTYMIYDARAQERASNEMRASNDQVCDMIPYEFMTDEQRSDA